MSTAIKIYTGTRDTQEYARSTAEALSAIVRKKPRVHCITNTIAMDFTANILLAVGAHPSMTLGSDEIADFIAVASSLSVNIGTLDNPRRSVIPKAIQTALDYNKPWILDPVSVHISPQRLSFAQDLCEMGPAVICGNQAEINVLSGGQGACAARELANQTGAVVAQTGEVDLVTDGVRSLMISNGHSMQTRLSGIGCATTALIAAFLAVDHDCFDATVQAVLAMGVAGEESVNHATGPGSLHMSLLDTVYSLDYETLNLRAKVIDCEVSG